MGYHAPDADEVYDYVFRRGNHAPRHLTDGFGWSILFVNDGSHLCKDFLTRYGQELCYLTADRIRFVFFSGLTKDETEKLASEAHSSYGPRSAPFLSRILRAVKNPFRRNYDQEREVWEELRPEPLYPLDSNERIDRHIKMECEILGAMPGAEEAYRFAQRAGIGRFMPCFLLFSDVVHAPAYVWPVAGQAPERVFTKLRGWIDAFYEHNKRVLSEWSKIEKHVEDKIASMKTTASDVERWRRERLGAWKCLQRVSLYQRRLESIDVPASLLKDIGSDGALDWNVQRLANSYCEHLTAVERRIADARATVEFAARLVTFESVEKVREELKSFIVTRARSFPSAVSGSLAAAERACHPLSPLLPLPNQLSEWWQHVRQLPKRRHDAYRYCWKPYSIARYGVDEAVTLGDLLRVEYAITLNAACAVSVLSPPQEAASFVLERLASHLAVEPGPSWTVSTQDYRLFLTRYFSHLVSSVPPWLLEKGPKLIDELSWGDCIPSSELIQECGRKRCLAKMPRLASLLEQLPGELQAQTEKQTLMRRDSVKAALNDVISSAGQWLAEGDWLQSDRASVAQALHDGLARKRQELEKAVFEAASNRSPTAFRGSVLPDQEVRNLMKLLDDYRSACEGLEFPYAHDDEVLRISLESDRSHQSMRAGRDTPSLPDVAAKKELIKTEAEANEALAKWPKIEIESLSWSPSGKLYEVLRKTVDRRRLEALFPNSNRSIWQKLTLKRLASNDVALSVVSKANREDIIRLLDQLDIEELLAIERNLRKSDKTLGATESRASTKSALHEFILSAIGLAPPLSKTALHTDNLFQELNPSKGFDVFLAHNSADREAVFELGKVLRSHGVYPWIDVEQVPPGRWFQDVLQSAMRSVKSAAVLIGKSGLGRWQMVELRTFISQCVERNIPVIPVLLPGVAEIPAELPFLRQLHSVRFHTSIEEEDTVAAMVWGITGKKRVP